jgi:hypothetical protein
MDCLLEKDHTAMNLQQLAFHACSRADKIKSLLLYGGIMSWVPSVKSWLKPPDDPDNIEGVLYQLPRYKEDDYYNDDVFEYLFVYYGKDEDECKEPTGLLFQYRTNYCDELYDDSLGFYHKTMSVQFLTNLEYKKLEYKKPRIVLQTNKKTIYDYGDSTHMFNRQIETQEPFVFEIQYERMWDSAYDNVGY